MLTLFLGWSSSHSATFPHTLFMTDPFNRTSTELDATAMLYCFAQCLIKAKQIYGVS